jgi:hypothetical protein
MIQINLRPIYFREFSNKWLHPPTSYWHGISVKVDIYIYIYIYIYICILIALDYLLGRVFWPTAKSSFFKWGDCYSESHAMEQHAAAASVEHWGRQAGGRPTVLAADQGWQSCCNGVGWGGVELHSCPLHCLGWAATQDVTLGKLRQGHILWTRCNFTLFHKPIIRNSRESFKVMMSSPTQTTMDTFDKIMCPCVNECWCLNRGYQSESVTGNRQSVLWQTKLEVPKIWIWWLLFKVQLWTCIQSIAQIP